MHVCRNAPVVSDTACSSAGFLNLVYVQFDALRTARFAAFGFAVHAPTGHVWYNILDNYVYPSEPTRCAPGVFGLYCQVMGFIFGLASAKRQEPSIQLDGRPALLPGWRSSTEQRQRRQKQRLAHTACSARAVVAKMALDQLFWTPIALVLFFACFTLLEGRSMAYLRSQLRAKFLPTLVKGFALWPAAHLVNFRYVPNGMRILYVNMVQVRLD